MYEYMSILSLPLDIVIEIAIRTSSLTDYLNFMSTCKQVAEVDKNKYVHNRKLKELTNVGFEYDQILTRVIFSKCKYVEGREGRIKYGIMERYSYNDMRERNEVDKYDHDNALGKRLIKNYSITKIYRGKRDGMFLEICVKKHRLEYESDSHMEREFRSFLPLTIDWVNMTTESGHINSVVSFRKGDLDGPRLIYNRVEKNNYCYGYYMNDQPHGVFSYMDGRGSKECSYYIYGNEITYEAYRDYLIGVQGYD